MIFSKEWTGRIGQWQFLGGLSCFDSQNRLWQNCLCTYVVWQLVRPSPWSRMQLQCGVEGWRNILFTDILYISYLLIYYIYLFYWYIINVLFNMEHESMSNGYVPLIQVKIIIFDSILRLNHEVLPIKSFHFDVFFYR